MPPHVAKLNLNMDLLGLQMEQAHTINPAVKTGLVLKKDNDRTTP